ncbi:MAG: PilZ domain-containing protein [Smithellaceae bacterium]|nr:PilZ domain-containing protein [Smithellaceae bacterium]
MASIFNIARRLFRRREQRRFVVQGGTFVVIAPGTQQEYKVQLVDISQGGLAFIYRGSPSELESSGVLKFLAENPHLKNIKFETVSDIPAPGEAQAWEPHRRRGVMFRWLGILEQTELSEYIKKISIGEK